MFKDIFGVYVALIRKRGLNFKRVSNFKSAYCDDPRLMMHYWTSWQSGTLLHRGELWYLFDYHLRKYIASFSPPTAWVSAAGCEFASRGPISFRLFSYDAFAPVVHSYRLGGLF